MPLNPLVFQKTLKSELKLMTPMVVTIVAGVVSLVAKAYFA